MKSNGLIVSVMAVILAAVSGTGICAVPDALAEDALRALVVENPDSLLEVLDAAERKPRSSLPPYRMDLYRALAYNEKRMPVLVKKYAVRGLEIDSAGADAKTRLNLLTLLSDAGIVSGDWQGSVEAASKGIEVARSMGNRPAEYSILTTMAKIAFGMGDGRQGFAYLDRVISSGSGSGSARELANVSSAYGVKIVELYAAGRFEEALAESRRRLETIRRIDEAGGAPDGFTDQQRAYTYARMASSAEMAGRPTEAQEAFRRFMSTAYGNTVAGRAYITDYLLESRQWRKALEFTRPLYSLYGAGDTISSDYHSLLISNARAWAGLGDYREGYALMARAGVIQDSLYRREKESRAQELAAVFAMNEKEVEIERARSEAYRKNLLLMGVAGLAVVISLVLAVIYIQYRGSLRRNRIISRQIDEMTAQREIIHRQEKAREDEDAAQFSEIERRLLDSRKYLEHDYGRDSLFGEIGGLSKGRVSQLIQRFAGLTVSDYINKLRVEHSVKLIQEHPEWTIDAIADASGYARKATFYANFDKIYGLTPAQYRKQRLGG